MGNVFVTLQQKLPQLRPAERRVADAVLESPRTVVALTLSELAERCDVSVASIVRMCKSIGFPGFKDFRIALASALGSEQTSREFFHVSDIQIAASDTAAEAIAKIAYQDARAIEETAKLIDTQALDAIVEACMTAERIDLFGVASSGLAAQDLQMKLHRIGIPCFWWADTHLSLTSVGITTPRSFALAISHSGTTLEAVQFLETARSRGAQTAAITNFPESPLSTHADHVLTTWAHDDGMRAGAMPSRIAQLAVIDFILVRLVQRDLGNVETRLRSSYHAIREHRIDR